jgi:cytochrome c oxidase subunit IV
MTIMENEKHSIQSYNQIATVLLVLLCLTGLTIWVAGLHLGAISVGVALLIASIKGTTVLLYFMHLKFEQLYMKIFVAGVFLLFALVIIVTFLDYLFR